MMGGVMALGYSHVPRGTFLEVQPKLENVPRGTHSAFPKMGLIWVVILSRISSLFFRENEEVFHR
jgi:hypothetical protein